MSNYARSLLACASLSIACALFACGGDDDDSSSNSSNKGGSGSSDNSSTKAGSSSAQPDESCKQTLGFIAPSPLCVDCVCEKCPDKAVACDKTCWDLLRCMHEKCGSNEANLDSCASGECSMHAAGLSAAKAVQPCAYASADRDLDKAQRTSCLISCNYGPIPNQ